MQACRTRVLSRRASSFGPRNLVSWLRLIFLAGISQRDRIAVFKRDFLKISIFGAVDGFHDLDRNRLADSLSEIRSRHSDLGEPSRWVALEFPVFDLPVITLHVHVDDDMRIDPVHLGDGALEWDLHFHIEDRRGRVVRQQQSGYEHGKDEQSSEYSSVHAVLRKWLQLTILIKRKCFRSCSKLRVLRTPLDYRVPH